MPRTSLAPQLALPLLLLLLLAPSGAAQIQEEDLTTPPPDAGPAVIEEDLAEPTFAEMEDETAPSLDEEAVTALFTEAERMLLEGDEPTALLSFGQLVDLFETHLASAAQAEEAARLEAEEAARLEAEANEAMTADEEAGASEETPADEEAASEETPEPPVAEPEHRFLDNALRPLFVRILAYRAELYHAFGDDDSTASTLERMLRIDPGAGLDRDRVEASFLKRFDGLRKKQVGELLVLAEPPDLELEVDGHLRAFDPTIPLPLLAGERRIIARRPGYAPQDLETKVRAGRQGNLEITLERTHPVLRLHTRPSGAQVLLDGVPVGTTSGVAPPDLLPQASSVAYRSEEFSAEMVIEDLEPGLHVIEVRAPGHRAFREELRLDQLLDYPLPPIVLEGEGGYLVLRNFPVDGRLTLNDRAHRFATPPGSRPRVELSPGNYRVMVTSGRARMFAAELRIADRQTVELNVRLRPGLSYVGSFGADARAHRDLDDSVELALARSEAWALIDNSEEGSALLRSASRRPDGTLDWSALQARLDTELPGLLYLAAGIDGTRTRFYLLPSAPGPARADVLELPRGDARALDQLLIHLEPNLPFERPALGALLLDSRTAGHPVVVEVTPGSSAEGVGLLPGDSILAAGGSPVNSRRQVEERLLAATDVLSLSVDGANGPRQIELRLRPSPTVLRTERDGISPSAAWARLAVLEEEATPDRRWLLRLDRALLLFEAQRWADAATLLETVDAPQSSHGFGQAAVDYWLGLALERSGDFAGARKAYSRALELPGARLYHADGPYLLPRVQARIAGLGGS